MPIQNATEPYLPATGESQHGRKNPWVRAIVYLVLITVLGLIAWRVYQNKQKTAANSASQAAALLARPVPVQVAPAEQKPMPIYLTGLGTVTPYYTVTVKARGVTAFTLLLSPDQFDLDQPITVVVNGHAAPGSKVEKSVRTLMKWAAADNDRTMLFGAELRINLR